MLQELFPENFTLNPTKKKLKCGIVGKFSVEESAISSKRALNDDFVEQFSALNIELVAGFVLMGQVMNIWMGRE